MADYTLKSDDNNDLVLSNNHGGAKIEINEDDSVDFTGTINVPGSAGSSLVLLNTTTIDPASPVSFVAFNSSLITTTYNAYKIILQGLSSAADDFDLEASFSNDNGSSINVTVKSTYSYMRLDGSGQGWVHNQNNHVIAQDAEGVDTDSGISGVLEVIIAPEVDNLDVHTSSWATTQNQNGDHYGYLTNGVSTSEVGDRVNYIKIDDVNSNLDIGKISLYGYKI